MPREGPGRGRRRPAGAAPGRAGRARDDLCALARRRAGSRARDRGEGESTPQARGQGRAAAHAEAGAPPREDEVTAGRPLSRLLGEAGVVPLARDGGDPEVLGVCVDSRQVRPGDLFVALRGERHDGLTFVPDAIARGARAIVAESSRRWPATEAAWVRVGRARPAAARLARAWHAAPD